MNEVLQEYADTFSEGWAKGLAQYVPDYMIPGMARYIVHGKRPGHFLSCFLSNDLMGALSRADDLNKRQFWQYGNFLYNYAPTGCFGSPEKFEDWIKSGGMKGLTGDDETEYGQVPSGGA